MTMYTPNDWLKHYNQSYKSTWYNFEKWLGNKNNTTYKELLAKDPREIRNIIDDYLYEISESRTTKSLKNTKSVIRSFFAYNDIILPKPKFKLRGGKELNRAKLTPQNLHKFIMAAKPRDKSFLIFKFQSLQDNERMMWINKNAWPQIKSQLDNGGWTDRNGKLWKDILRIELSIERKGNENPYFCFVGKDAIDSLKGYFDYEGDPKTNELIWRGINSINTLNILLLKLARRTGEIPKTPKKSFDTSVRYGYNLHEMRDVAKSLWHESGADLSVCDFCMGHIVDALGYDKIYTLSPDYAVKEFIKAEPYLKISTSIQKPEELGEKEKIQDEEIARLREMVEELRKGPEFLDLKVHIMDKVSTSIMLGEISSQLDMEKLLDKIARKLKKPYMIAIQERDELEPDPLIKRQIELVEDAVNDFKKKKFEEIKEKLKKHEEIKV